MLIFACLTGGTGMKLLMKHFLCYNCHTDSCPLMKVRRHEASRTIAVWITCSGAALQVEVIHSPVKKAYTTPVGSAEDQDATTGRRVLALCNFRRTGNSSPTHGDIRNGCEEGVASERVDSIEL